MATTATPGPLRELLLARNAMLAVTIDGLGFVMEE